MKSIESLYRPVLHTVCTFWRCSGARAELKKDDVEQSIRHQLAVLRDEVEEDPVLKREYRKIEQPLLFFIDYMMKEGNLHLDKPWVELARDYNELSGDEKFFDLLGEALNDPDTEEQLKSQYLFMGLGFDGSHRGEPDQIERKMKVCTTRFQTGFNPLVTPMSNEDEMTAPVRHVPVCRRVFSVYGMLILLVVVAIASFGCNLYMLRKWSLEYREALHDSVRNAQTALTRDDPQTANSGKENGAK